MKSRIRMVVPILLLLVASTVGANAQKAKPADTKPLDIKPAAANATPVIGVGDVVQIQVLNHEDLDNTIVVPSNGKILIKEAGEVQAAGLTSQELATQIDAKLKDILNNYSVLVSLREIHSRRVTAIGALRQPGTFDMGVGDWHIVDLVAASGGFINRAGPAPAEQFTGRIIRNNKVLQLDLPTAFRDPASKENIPLQNGDVAVFEAKEAITLPDVAVHVLGQVPRPGTYLLNDNRNLLWLLGQSGYPLPTAALSKTYVLRGESQMLLDLRPVMAGQADEQATRFRFQNDDLLYVPELTTKYVVWGQVAHPGPFLIPEKGTVMLMDALNTAGIGQGADLKKVHLVRTVDGKQTETVVDVNKMLKTGKMKDNVPLQPNDIVFVPPANHKRGLTLQDLFTPFSLLGFLGFRFFN